MPATEPALALDLGIAPEATLCDAIPVRLVVRSTGTAACRDVRLQVALPDGLAQRDGRRPVAYALGGLGVGESRQATLALTAGHTGAFTVRAVARTAGDVRFRVLLTSDPLTRPVEETESTRLY